MARSKPDALYVVLDCGLTMGQEDMDGKKSFDLAKEAVDWIITKKIFTQSKDLMDFILVGTDTTENNLGIANVVCDRGLSTVNFDHIRYLQGEVLMTQQESCVLNGLIVAVDQIRNAGEDIKGAKRILLVTNGAGPIAGQDEMKHVANAIRALGIELVILGIDESTRSPSNSVEMLEKFVDDADGTKFSWSEAFSVLNQFSQPKVQARANRKNWEVAPGVRLPLAMYVKTMIAKNPLKTVNISCSADGTSEEYKRRVVLLAPKTDADMTSSADPTTQSEDFYLERDMRVVDKADAVYGYAFGKSRVVITEDELAQFKDHNFNEGEERGCMKLIQFTKKENIPASFFIGNSSFVVVPGWEKKTSARDTYLMRTTLSLIQGMFEEGVAAICRYASDASKHLQLMAMFPQRDAETNQLYLVATRIPFMDDWRAFTFPEMTSQDNEPDANQLSLVDDLITSMDLTKSDVHYDNIANPYFQRQCTMMKLRALNNTGPELDDKIRSLVAPSVFLKWGLEPSLSDDAKKVLSSFATTDPSSKNAFYLQPVVRSKRVKREIVPQSKPHLIGISEDDMKDGLGGAYGNQGRFSDYRVPDTSEFRERAQYLCAHNNDLISLIRNFEDLDEGQQEVVDVFMFKRDQMLSNGQWRQFNEWLMKLHTKPQFFEFRQHMDQANLPSVITSSECAESPYTVDDAVKFWSGILVPKGEEEEKPMDTQPQRAVKEEDEDTQYDDLSD